MEPSEKTRENRLRRMATRQGFGFRKTRRLDRRAADFGTYTLTPAKGKARTFRTMDDLEEFLTRSQVGPGGAAARKPPRPEGHVSPPDPAARRRAGK